LLLLGVRRYAESFLLVHWLLFFASPPYNALDSRKIIVLREVNLVRASVGAFRLAIFMFLAASTFVSAQQKSRDISRPGVLSGRVFAITKGGDVKPGRMARVYLFYLYRSVKYAEAHKEDENSAGMAWLEANNKAMEKYNQTSVHEGANWSEARACSEALRAHSNALMDTLKWAEKEKKSWQMILDDADEEGNFAIKASRPGKYILVVRGRAGFNEAFWVSDNITIASGVETTVKLSSPEQACLVPQTQE
jgi:hypothetical protein